MCTHMGIAHVVAHVTDNVVTNIHKMNMSNHMITLMVTKVSHYIVNNVNIMHTISLTFV